MKTRSDGYMKEPIRIVAAAGGELISRVRLQNAAFFLELAGLGSGHRFDHENFPPFSNDLDFATDVAHRSHDLREEWKKADWGGKYSVLTTEAPYEGDDGDACMQVVAIAKKANPIALDLAAAAAYLASIGDEDPWDQARRQNPLHVVRKGNLKRARDLYRRFAQLDLPEPLPDI